MSNIRSTKIETREEFTGEGKRMALSSSLRGTLPVAEQIALGLGKLNGVT